MKALSVGFFNQWFFFKAARSVPLPYKSKWKESGKALSFQLV
jgi:hypothetical protein